MQCERQALTCMLGGANTTGTRRNSFVGDQLVSWSRLCVVHQVTGQVWTTVQFRVGTAGFRKGLIKVGRFWQGARLAWPKWVDFGKGHVWPGQTRQAKKSGGNSNFLHRVDTKQTRTEVHIIPTCKFCTNTGKSHLRTCVCLAHRVWRL